MCIAILQTKSATALTFDEFENSWKRNPDGAGMLFANAGKMVTIKELDCLESFYDTYRYIFDGGHAEGALAIHFRYATHGLKNEANCHPFLVDNKLGFIHNGIIHSVKATATKSDTRVFMEEVLRKLPKGFYKDAEIMDAITEHIGWSKLVFVDHNGDFAINNKRSGHWRKGTWFSNSSYLGSMPSRERLTA